MRFYLLHAIKMKKEASHFLKQMFNALRALAKAKSMSLKSKTSALKTRLIIFSLLRNKKVLLGSLSDKVHALLGHHHHQHNPHDDHNNHNDQTKAIVLYQPMPSDSCPRNPPMINCTELVVGPNDQYYQFEDYDDDKYPDLTHSMFDSADGDEEYWGDQSESVIDLVRNAKEEGEEFNLEDEIDEVADLFIRRFHRQIRLEKQQSLKRYQEMLERSV